MAIFQGAGVAIVTPMKENKEVDYQRLEQLIEYQIGHQTDAIIICGTTGEASTLTHEEHLECIKVAVSATKKRVPVIAGTGSNCTETAKYLTKEAYNLGADGALVVTPYYNKATQKGLVQHFTEIAKVADLPIVLYNVPGRTGCSLQANTIAQLNQEVENIVAVKEATGNISFVADVLKLTQGNMDVYSGNDDQIVPVLSLGGKGVISVLSNILPEETHKIVATYMEGKVEESRKLQLNYLELIHSLFCEVNPIPVKKALQLMGVEVGPLRSPLTEMEEMNVQRLAKAMQEVGLKIK